MEPLAHQITRRHLLGRSPLALGSLALASLCHAERGTSAGLSSPGPGGASTTSVVATLIGEYTVFSLNFWIEPDAIIDASVFFKPL